MKNMKKLLQRAMVFTLTAAMLVGTPMTASAAGLVDLYSVSDGTTDDIYNEDPGHSHTGTVTNTDTNTNTGILKDNEEMIIAIVLDKDYVNAEKGVKETLKASFITANGEALSGYDNPSRNVLEQLAGKIKWEVLYADGTTVKNNVAANKVLSISASAADRTEVTLNPRQGTVKGEEMIVRATIQGRYCLLKNKTTNEIEVKELTTNSTEGYEAEAKVYIKEYSESLKFEGLPTAYAKHTINLNDYLVRTPSTANDDISWVSSDAKVAVVTAAGVVTFKKAVTTELTITAVSEKGKMAVWKLSGVEAGTPASKVEILETADATAAFKTTTTDLNTELEGWKDITKVVYVKMYAKEKAYTTDGKNPVATSAAVGTEVAAPEGTAKLIEMANGTKYIGEDKKVHELNVTDQIDWSSNKAAVASVAGGKTSATLTAKTVGKATITAKTSSGKKANLAVTVKATLDKLEITNKETQLYTGQSLQMTYKSTPSQSKDAVAWSIEKVGNKPNPNATINSKGVLTIKPKLDANCKTVTVLLQSKKKIGTDYVTAEKKTINLVQSNITDIKIMEKGKTIADAEVVNGKVKANKRLANKNDNKTTLNVPKTGTYKVEVKGSSADTLAWKSSNASVAEIISTGDQVKIKANKSGSATITVSGVYENGTKAAAIKTTFKVTVQQPVKTVTLNKTSVVLNQKDSKKGPQKQTVSFKATLGPKGSKKETVNWRLVSGEKASVDSKTGKLTMDAPVVGNVFVVEASVPTGAKATATVKILNKTTGVAIAQKADLKNGAPELFTWTNPKNSKTANNTTEIALGSNFKMYPFVKTSDWHKAGLDNCEGVTYTVNKKGIVTIGSDGTVYGIKPGTVTITAKTPMNKKATLKVTVK